ncbi:MAG TPA: 7-cyano-7-deazaguanine synthase QueC [Caulobacteraceae bacterium]|jgi:7-cyano-7-deazaguanine synthase|nr:7-cyano-7-deazaguanine synthase QueC [Caulobacteraceae bacterium]
MVTARSALVLFSGGQDSAVCLGWALAHHARVETVGFDYGQRHVAELAARQILLARLPALVPHAGALGPDHRLDLASFGTIGESALTTAAPIATRPDGLPSTFVPGRNLVFLTYAAALAERRGLDVLVGGMCETDYSGYPDCRRATLDALETALELGIGRAFPILTPLMRLDKAATWALAKQLGGEPLVELVRDESHTCYENVRDAHAWGAGCGRCPACALRAKGWAAWVASGRKALAA